jgi:3,5-epimerase/4-reductase
MPITADTHPRNFITKIVSYKKICSITNSMSVLPDLLPVLADMIHKGETGTINLVNPGIISHNEILEMYKDMVDASHSWENMSIEDQDKVLASKRSNNHLGTIKLEQMYPHVPHIRDSIKKCLQNMK